MSIDNQNSSDGVGNEMLLSRYLEGRLDDAQKQAAEELLRTNPAARRRLDALREEEKLLRESLETLSEPGKRLGDKVIAALHSEEHARLAALRSRRMRRNIFAAMSAAATIVFCVWLIRPRDAMGTVASGTAATVVTPVGERRALTKNSRIYEGDQLRTAQGQFVRLRLGGESVLDVDENSALEFAAYAPSEVHLASGRIGLSAHDRDVIVRVPQGTVRASAGALIDVWLPQPSQARWPEALDLLMEGASAKTSEAHPDLVVVTVLAGSAAIGNEKSPGVAVSAGNRVRLTAQTRKIQKIDMAGSHVLETRRGRSWHALDGVSPQDRTVIGLLERPNFVELGERLGMTRHTPQDVAAALSALHQAVTNEDAAQRAEKLAQAQQQLRLAYEPLKAGDERRAFGRTLEGLAHVERGRALVASTDLPAANAAFDAARVAFEEALKQDAGKREWAAALAAGPSVTLRDLSAANQSALLAEFNHALALYWLEQTRGTESKLPADASETEAAKAFGALRDDLGRSVEAMAARLAEGLALAATENLKPETRNSKLAKAIDALEEVLAISNAGLSKDSRAHTDGIRQAALAALVRLHIERDETDKACNAAQDFALLYPLEDSSNSPAAREIERALSDSQWNQARKAIDAGDYAAAVERFDEWLAQRASDTQKTSEARLQLLGALVQLENGGRAQQLAAQLETALTPEQRAQHRELLDQAKALPSRAGEKIPALVPGK